MSCLLYLIASIYRVLSNPNATTAAALRQIIILLVLYLRGYHRAVEFISN